MGKDLRPDIEAAVEAMGRTKTGAGRLIKMVPGQLAPGESVQALAMGQHEKRAGLLVATDKRLLFLTKVLFSSSSDDFPYSRISSVSAEQDGMFAGLTVHAQGRDAKFTRMDKQVAQQLVNTVRASL